ncbi:She1p SCDLUD_000762 [Saccharomycodes ludwigii]|uniref:She1p n=1 Tax=Saccharomycodes ludwigii TaxID=36035 RepID=UPI001E85DFEE|nr:hypothetical protein SCDLUD_000762 [Saccharomycodes ludwigii]KAH3903149.1 hypothetical protein SCDLUD_000762 [Saccharomycodes ludwigii]
MKDFEFFNTNNIKGDENWIELDHDDTENNVFGLDVYNNNDSNKISYNNNNNNNNNNKIPVSKSISSFESASIISHLGVSNRFGNSLLNELDDRARLKEAELNQENKDVFNNRDSFSAMGGTTLGRRKKRYSDLHKKRFQNMASIDAKYTESLDNNNGIILKQHKKQNNIDKTYISTFEKLHQLGDPANINQNSKKSNDNSDKYQFNNNDSMNSSDSDNNNNSSSVILIDNTQHILDYKNRKIPHSNYKGTSSSATANKRMISLKNQYNYEHSLPLRKHGISSTTVDVERDIYIIDNDGNADAIKEDIFQRGDIQIYEEQTSTTIYNSENNNTSSNSIESSIDLLSNDGEKRRDSRRLSKRLNDIDIVSSKKRFRDSKGKGRESDVFISPMKDITKRIQRLRLSMNSNGTSMTKEKNINKYNNMQLDSAHNNDNFIGNSSDKNDNKSINKLNLNYESNLIMNRDITSFPLHIGNTANGGTDIHDFKFNINTNGKVPVAISGNNSGNSTNGNAVEHIGANAFNMNVSNRSISNRSVSNRSSSNRNASRTSGQTRIPSFARPTFTSQIKSDTTNNEYGTLDPGRTQSHFWEVASNNIKNNTNAKTTSDIVFRKPLYNSTKTVVPLSTKKKPSISRTSSFHSVSTNDRPLTPPQQKMDVNLAPLNPNLNNSKVTSASSSGSIRHLENYPSVFERLYNTSTFAYSNNHNFGAISTDTTINNDDNNNRSPGKITRSKTMGSIESPKKISSSGSTKLNVRRSQTTKIPKSLSARNLISESASSNNVAGKPTWK